MTSKATRIGAASWAIVGLFAAGIVAIGDAPTALGWEPVAAPVAVLVVHGVFGAWWSVRCAHARRFGTALAIAPAALALAAIWAPAVTALPARVTVNGETGGPDVILVTLDTFRFDRLGANGGSVPTPNLDRLAAEGTRYTCAIASAPLTGPSHASLLTGLTSRQHGLVRNGMRVAVSTIVPDVARRGYRTGAFLSSRVLSRDTGLSAGFSHYDDAFGPVQRLGWLPILAPLRRSGAFQRPGRDTVDRALRWWREDRGPVFLWVHLYDAHAPYDPPAEFTPSDAAMTEARRADDAAWDGELAHVEGRHAGEGRLLYDAEVRTVDDAFGRLLAAVPAEAVVVVVADHGEALGEHGYWFNHGALLDDVALRVPLIVRWPGHTVAGAVVEDLVSTASVAGLLRAATGDGSVPDGAVIPAAASVESWTPGQQSRRPVAGSGQREPIVTAAIRLPGAKIVAQRGHDPVFYDLAADPSEDHPLPVTPGDAAFAGQASAAAADDVKGPVDAALLESLGYVE